MTGNGISLWRRIGVEHCWDYDLWTRRRVAPKNTSIVTPAEDQTTMESLLTFKKIVIHLETQAECQDMFCQHYNLSRKSEWIQGDNLPVMAAVSHRETSKCIIWSDQRENPKRSVGDTKTASGATDTPEHQSVQFGHRWESIKRKYQRFRNMQPIKIKIPGH